MFKLLKYLKPYTWPVIVTVVLTFGQVMSGLALPDYMARIVNEGIVGANMGVIISTGVLMLAISLLGAACMIGAGYLAARVATGFSTKMRERVFAKVESFSLTEFNKFSTASLITRSTNDIQQVQTVLFMMMRIMLLAPLMGIGAIIMAYRSSPSMTWIMGLGVLVMVGIIGVLFSVALPRFKRLQKLVDRINLVTRENLTGLKVIRAFNTEKQEEGKFDRANKDLTALNLFLNRLMVVMQPMMMLIFNFTSLAIIWIGASLIGAGDLPIGNMIAFMQYAMQVLFSFTMISMIFIMIPRASVSGERVAEVINTEPVIKDPEKTAPFSDQVEATVEFRDVTFAYPGAEYPVLENISFTAERGRTTAIVGGTGSGKSTLINLIPRFYDVTYGHVLVNGADVREVKMKALYDQLGYVPQKGVLFSGTIESNINYGAPQATDKETGWAARVAQAAEFIAEKEKGFRDPIAQGGANVSGGQKQRLAIARAVVKKPSIYIFDDSFSALDFKTDAALRQALNDETRGATVLIVAQRIGTIMNADKIIVLDRGRVVGTGKHKELLAACPVYREIALSQFSEKELGI